MDPPGDGYFFVTVATVELSGTEYADLDEIQLDIHRVDLIHRSVCSDPMTEEKLTISTAPFSISIPTKPANLPRPVVQQVPVPPGCIVQVRLVLDEMRAVRGAETVEVKVPSGGQSGLKIKPVDGGEPFPIVTDQTTVVRVDYDPNVKLVSNNGQGLIEKPVLEGYVVPSTDAVGTILDEVVLTFLPGTDDAVIEALVASGGGTIKEHYPHGFVTVKLANSALLPDAVNFYSLSPLVRVSLPNTTVDALGPNPFPVGLPDDPLYNQTAPTGFEQVNLDSVKALDAWRVTTGSSNVIVGVVDSGFDLLHADILPNIWINEEELPQNVRDNAVRDADGNITFAILNSEPANDVWCPKANSPPTDLCDPLDLVDGDCVKDITLNTIFCTPGYGFQDGVDDDLNGFPDDVVGWDFSSNDNLPEPPSLSDSPFHGTAVAGIAAGVGNNGLASAGVSWNSRIMLAKGTVIRNPAGEFSGNQSVVDRVARDSMIRALVYAHDNGASVINLSLGTSITREDAEIDGCSEGGIHGVSAAKFDEGVRRLSTEWEEQFATRQSAAVLALAMNNCGGEDNDREGNFFYPAFTVARADIGTTFVHSTMVTVTSADTWNPGNMQPYNFPPLSSKASSGVTTVLIAAPGVGWHALDAQSYPPTGLNTGIRSCTGTD